MAYRNKTYVIFDGDKDMWAYAYMKGWKRNDNMDFNFYDAHEINLIKDGVSERSVKNRLRERLNNSKQSIVLIGESTRYLYKYIRWEIEVCQELDVPVVAVNLNGTRVMDIERCPPILRDRTVMHISFRSKIIKYALDDFCENYEWYKRQNKINWYYFDSTYTELGL